MAIIEMNKPTGTPPTISRDPHIQLYGEGYKISAFGDSSAMFEYGEPAEVVIAGHRYIAYVDLPDEVDKLAVVTAGQEVADSSDDVESVFDFWLYEAEPVDGEPVDMEEDDEDEDEDEGDKGNGSQEGISIETEPDTTSGVTSIDNNTETGK